MKSLKQTAALLIVTVLIAMFPLTAFASGATLSVQSAEAAPGDTVSVSVSITGNPGFSYLKIRYSFDSEKLELVKAVNGTVSTDAFIRGSNMLSWDSGSDAESDGTLAELTFKVKENAAGTASVTLTVVGCFDNEERIVPVIVSDGAINIRNDDVRPLKGDVDGNGILTAEDARLALRASARLEHFDEGSREFLAADVDGSGSIAASDARHILRASARLEDLSDPVD